MRLPTHVEFLQIQLPVAACFRAKTSSVKVEIILAIMLYALECAEIFPKNANGKNIFRFYLLIFLKFLFCIIDAIY